MANASEQDWDNAAPGATDDISVGDDEIRYLRQSTHDRINKSHVHLAAGGVGGEPLEGSARVHTATVAPTLLVIGAKDKDGSAADVLISDDTTLAEGAIWAHTTTAVCQVYIAGAWVSMSYLPLAGGTVTGATTFSAASTALTVTNNALISGTITVTGATTLNGAGTGLTVTNNALVSGTLTVTGATTLNSLVTFNGAGGIHSSNGFKVSTGNQIIDDTSVLTNSVSSSQAGLRVFNNNAAQQGIYVETTDDGDGIRSLNNGNAASTPLILTSHASGRHLRFVTSAVNTSKTAGDFWMEGNTLHVYLDAEYTLDMTVVV